MKETTLRSQDSRPRVTFSFGMKMLLVTAGLLGLSVLVCGWATLSLSRRLLRENLVAKIARENQVVKFESERWLSRQGPDSKIHLHRLAEELIREPEIQAIALLDSHKHLLAEASKPMTGTHRISSFLTPIHSNHRVVGWVRVWYSPGLALEDFWHLGKDLVIVMSCGTVGLFVFVFLVVNEWILTRPFKELVAAIDEAESKGSIHEIRSSRRNDEWGVLSERLNRFLTYVTDTQQQARVLYEGAQLLALPWELQGALERLLSELMQRHDLSSCLIFGPGDEGRLNVQFSSGVSLSFAQSLIADPGKGIVGIVFASGVPRLLEDIQDTESDPLLHDLVHRQQVRSGVLLPMTTDGKPWGVAGYFSRTSHRVSTARTESLRLFTDQLALALRNAQRMSELKTQAESREREAAAAAEELTKTQQRLVQKVRELKSIYQLALATAASARVEEIIQVIVGGIKELVDVQGAAFFIIDKTSGKVVALPPAFDCEAPDALSLSFRVEESPWLEQVLIQGTPQILNFVEGVEQLPSAWAAVDIRSILALPLRQEQSIEGLFCVVNKLNGLFTPEDIQLLSLLTSRVTDVLQRLALDGQLRQRVKDLSVLHDIATHLPSPPVLKETVEVIARITRQALPGTALCGFFLHHPESDALVMMGGEWDTALPLDPKALTVGISEKLPLSGVFREQQSALYGAEAVPSLWDKDDLVRGLPLKDLLYLPLSVDQRAIGVMAIGCIQSGTLTDEHRRLAGLIADQVAVIIERSRLYERLKTANEKLEQVNTLKNEFISMVSHELRTPLTTIKGFVSIVIDEETGPLNPQQRHFLVTSDRAIDRLALLVSDLLDISRVEGGQIQMRLRPVPLQEVLSSIATNFEPQLKAKSLRLTLRIANPLPPLMADPHRLTQVFDNLLTNAIKFTAEGGITITATDKGDFVMVSVKDTGIGMVKNEQDRIFEKFYQIKTGGGWPSHGTGLGLAIVKSIIESHRGKIWVESEPGQGADFRFLLPRARMDNAEETATPSSLLS